MNRATRRTLPTLLGAAILGNSLIRKSDLDWLNDLNRPRMQITLPQFAAVGVGYYAILGTVLHRANTHRDAASTRLAVTVIVLNEAWNVAFFRRRSPRNGFVGILGFCLPLGCLQAAVRTDPTSAAVLAPYAAWVVFYDIPWTYQLWKLNRR